MQGAMERMKSQAQQHSTVSLSHLAILWLATHFLCDNIGDTSQKHEGAPAPGSIPPICAQQGTFSPLQGGHRQPGGNQGCRRWRDGLGHGSRATGAMSVSRPAGVGVHCMWSSKGDAHPMQHVRHDDSSREAQLGLTVSFHGSKTWQR